MALTGFFLITFLAVHLTGNLQLLKDDEGMAFNIYAEFMGNNPLIQIVSKVNFALILMHAIWGILLTVKNRKARGSVGYAVTNKSSIWSSRNMGILGTLILGFIIIHLQHFWGAVHLYDTVEQVTYGDSEVSNLYAIVAFWFSKEWYVALYVICMAALGFHLWHGFSSVFQSLGLNHIKYNGIINFVGRAFSIIVPALFAWIPLYMYFFL
jgi:succinate dehydrogenase / fumarate reductase cytochrome b subunit